MITKLPLWNDMLRQQSRLRRFLIDAALFLGLLLVLDRAVSGILLSGLERYYGLEKPAQVLLVGHSHTVLGVDKLGLEGATGRSVAKYARQGADTFNRLVMLRHFLECQPEEPEIVVYDVDAHTFTGKGLSANSYRLFFPFIDTPSVADYVQDETRSSFEYLLRRCLKTSRFSEVTISLSARGWLDMWTNLKAGRVNVERLKKKISAGNVRRITFDTENVRAFEETVAEIRSRDIRLVLLYIPTLDVYNEVEPQQCDEAIRRFDAYAAADPGVTFLNYNEDLASKHELFHDPIHMNPAGQQAVTERLSKDLERILAAHGAGTCTR